jgi:hypothetical protein
MVSLETAARYAIPDRSDVVFESRRQHRRDQEKAIMFSTVFQLVAGGSHLSRGLLMFRNASLMILLCLGFLVGQIAAGGSVAPISLHPANPHYFLWRGKPTVLITSGEHYGAVLNLDFDYVRYLDELQTHGLNHTRTFSGTYREVSTSFKITENTLAPKPGKFISPWARSEQPGESDGGNKFNLARWNEAYFARLKDFLTKARERGIVVELNLFCPMYTEDLWLANPMNARNNINGIGQCPRQELYSLKQKDLIQTQIAVTQKLVAELRDFDNLYYEISNEPYQGSISLEWQHRIVDAIVETERDLPQRHLISLNIANGRKEVQAPHPAVSLFNFHYCTPPDAVAINYGLNKPIGENETGFRGHDDVLYRTEAWDFMLAGGALFNHLDYSFSASHPAGTLTGYQSPGGGSRELRRQLGILKRFFDDLEFVRMRPDAAVVRNVSERLVATVLSEEGNSYAIYLHVPLPAKPKKLAEHLRNGVTTDLSLQLPAGTYEVLWLDTKTGEMSPRSPTKHSGGLLTLSSPPFDNDIALKVTRQ